MGVFCAECIYATDEYLCRNGEYLYIEFSTGFSTGCEFSTGFPQSFPQAW